MSPATRRRILVGMGAAIGLGAAAAIWLLAFGERLPNGPVEIVWDRETCAHCKMHIGEPAFAAQLQTKSGTVLNFDDPGCLIVYAAKNGPAIHARYFRDHRGAGWLREERAAFAPVGRSPMGYGYGAVRAGPDQKAAIEFADLSERIERKE